MVPEQWQMFSERIDITIKTTVSILFLSLMKMTIEVSLIGNSENGNFID